MLPFLWGTSWHIMARTCPKNGQQKHMVPDMQPFFCVGRSIPLSWLTKTILFVQNEQCSVLGYLMAIVSHISGQGEKTILKKREKTHCKKTHTHTNTKQKTTTHTIGVFPTSGTYQGISNLQLAPFGRLAAWSGMRTRPGERVRAG